MKISESSEVLQRLLKDLEDCRADLTPFAKRLGTRGFEPSDPILASPAWQARIAQLNLCGPAHALVRFWWDNDQIEPLAEHASLEKAPLGFAFPYVIPVVPQPVDQQIGWHADVALGVPEPVARARLLLWFAVAHEPKRFGADRLFGQKVAALFPAVREPSGQIHPLRRPARWLYQAAASIVEACTCTATQCEQAGNDCWFSEPPSNASLFKFGPVEGPMRQLAQWACTDQRTLRKHNGRAGWWIQKIHGRRFAMWSSSKSRLAEIRAAQLRMTSDTTSDRTN